MGIKESISELRQKFDADLSEVRDSESIEKLRVSYLGKKGSVTELLKGLKGRFRRGEKENAARPINTAEARGGRGHRRTRVEAHPRWRRRSRPDRQLRSSMT